MSYRTQFSFFKQAHCAVYLDSAATTQKLDAVSQRVDDFSRLKNASVHRGGYALATQATTEFEDARSEIAQFIHANSSDEVVFTSGATESVNMIAQGLHPNMLRGNTILLSESEHHANILPWQALAKRLNLVIKVLPLEVNGVFSKSTLQSWLNAFTDDVAIFACAHVSNVLGNIYPIQTLCEHATTMRAISVIDGTQALAHLPVDVQSLGCDFYVFSGHKMYAPTGIGICWGKRHLLEALDPSKLGGEMVTNVSFTDYSTQPPPLKFEAGTPNISGALGLQEACRFLNRNFKGIQSHEHELYQYMLNELAKFPELTILGNQQSSIGLLSFCCATKDNHSIAMQLYSQGIALRFGQHCAMPLFNALGIDACLRISIGCYNDYNDINRFIEALQNALRQTHLTDIEQVALSNHTRQTNKEHKLTSDYHWEVNIKHAKNWSEKHRQLLLLSKALPLLEPSNRVPSNAVQGCEANVWLHKAEHSGELRSYSDSKVIRGILAVLLLKHNHLLESQSKQHAARFDYLEYLNSLGLSDYFSTGRKDGVRSVVMKMRVLYDPS
ncbi:aminotransferase class V-fold PLP-dependent enzyme [Glaciecola sp. SC05]|uniref:aminotransferase class V-fold PLP-dependent enzyme n=1 Tax=Glaciecola sp. SC05 TaxID=1987355 RepID=UPI003529CD91